MQNDISRDIAAVGRISSVPTILEIVTHITGMRFAAVARVTETTWTACAVRDNINFGLAVGGQLDLHTTICDEIRQHHNSVVFGHASLDPQWSTHHTPKLYGLESYISIPIFKAKQQFFGTLCAIDPVPANLSDRSILGSMELFAQLIGYQLDAEDAMDRVRTDLNDATSFGQSREKFIAVLGHDLRNPVHAITIGANVLKGNISDEKRRAMADLIDRSARRIDALIENTLDLSHSRMGDGIPVQRARDAKLVDEFRQVIAEVQSAHPEIRIESRISIDHEPFADTKRLGQLLGNLISNAVSHGDASEPITVTVTSDTDRFELCVINAGPSIPDDAVPKLFHPFERHNASVEQGLGLGLYIASQIAIAHGGTLDVSSSNRRTCFTLRIPNDSV
jgi:signal transduction histidine kinase